ncbi:MAG TPA: hypothetical protein VFX49_07895, partial [Chloroflexota bacterium]|nr:hypothetical protein [Chloroflexota bacterium]
LLLIGAGTLLLAAAVSSGSGFAAANAVRASRAAARQQAITINGLRPPECAGLTLTTLITGSGTITGTNGPDLIIGSAGSDSIDGLDGSDCIVAGGGDDDINAGAGADVILGGPGNDTINGLTGADVCYGGTGRNSLANCQYRY